MSDSTSGSTSDSTRRKGDIPGSAHAWLDEAASRLGIDPGVQRASVKGVLDLTAAVAHHRSRPAAPVTAFLVGLAAGLNAGSAADLREAIDSRIDDLTRLALENADTGTDTDTGTGTGTDTDR
ncbi:DUF6457 domain-containing protein [Corynebacterium bovis]|uniref:DUF6457 domain-containing protein n=1 Tax=Corynebacterium bovis TaxID=36808 RepID=UPI001C8CDA71|nr:DUF6457 domain-containing protein [Corynebacterium bovis]